MTQRVRVEWHTPPLERQAASLSFTQAAILLETEMPKMKTKSSAKKRFKITKTGKVKAGQAGKQHGMIKRTNDQIRKLRGTTVLKDCDAKVIKKKYMPYG
jgi:large subunit ribosomal protein L35